MVFLAYQRLSYNTLDDLTKKMFNADFCRALLHLDPTTKEESKIKKETIHVTYPTVLEPRGPSPGDPTSWSETEEREFFQEYFGCEGYKNDPPVTPAPVNSAGNDEASLYSSFKLEETILATELTQNDQELVDYLDKHLPDLPLTPYDLRTLNTPLSWQAESDDVTKFL